MKFHSQYTLTEEIFHSITHGIGAALAVAGLVVFVVLAAQEGDEWRIVSFSIYGGSLTLLYLASTLYHSFQDERLKRFFRHFDHLSIFLLIAGTYTPVTLISLRGAGRFSASSGVSLWVVLSTSCCSWVTING
jgi:hemolysin III